MQVLFQNVQWEKWQTWPYSSRTFWNILCIYHAEAHVLDEMTLGASPFLKLVVYLLDPVSKLGGVVPCCLETLWVLRKC